MADVENLIQRDWLKPSAGHHVERLPGIPPASCRDLTLFEKGLCRHDRG
jgi:hypothetical protein